MRDFADKFVFFVIIVASAILAYGFSKNFAPKVSDPTFYNKKCSELCFPENGEVKINRFKNKTDEEYLCFCKAKDKQ